MKNIKFLILTLTLALVAVSCESYDDYDTDREPIVTFAKKSQNINGVPEGGTKDQELEVFVSDVANTDRSFDIVVVPITDTETNPPSASENYTFDSSVIIPANERIGVITFTAIDVSISSDRTYVMLGIKEGEGYVSGGTITVALRN